MLQGQSRKAAPVTRPRIDSTLFAEMMQAATRDYFADVARRGDYADYSHVDTQKSPYQYVPYAYLLFRVKGRLGYYGPRSVHTMGFMPGFHVVDDFGQIVPIRSSSQWSHFANQNHD